MCIRDSIYTTCIRPILTYAHPVLLTASPAYLDLHRVTERRALRLIYRRPRLTKTSNAALYALNTRFPDLDSCLLYTSSLPLIDTTAHLIINLTRLLPSLYALFTHTLIIA